MEDRVHQEVLVRDQFRCRDCGKPTTEVHHIAARSMFGKNRIKDCWQVKNMITCCGEDHKDAGLPVNRKRHLLLLHKAYGYDYSDQPWARLLVEGEP